MVRYWCTEQGCDRLAVVRVTELDSGRGGHLCQEHACAWAAKLIMFDASIRLRMRTKPHELAVVRGGKGEVG